MPLRPSQQEAADKIIQFFKEGKTRVTLIGMAGTGKTFLTAYLIDKLRRDVTINPNYNNGLSYATAPTNKALAVLRSKIDCNVEFATIHSALCLTRWVNPKTGQEVFRRSEKRDDPFKKCKFVAIDEVSMLNSELEGGYDENNDYHRGYLDDYQFPILYVGDDHQLNPVGEPFSPVFHKDYPIVELTEIIRQGEGNPIIDLSRDTDLIYFKEPAIINGKGYMYSDNRGDLIESLSEVNGTDEMKYLAFTNDTVNDMNKAVRKRIYGERPKKIELGETIVFNKPYGEFYTNKEVKIDKFEIITESVPIPNGRTKFDSGNQPINDTDFVKLKYYRVNGSFQVIHEDCEAIHNALVKQVEYNCSKLGWNFRGKYYFKEMFADITYNHALTIHKSQGSTYKNTIINIGDIMINRKAEERQRLLYTAITRASDVLILNNVK